MLTVIWGPSLVLLWALNHPRNLCGAAWQWRHSGADLARSLDHRRPRDRADPVSSPLTLKPTGQPSLLRPNRVRLICRLSLQKEALGDRSRYDLRLIDGFRDGEIDSEASEGESFARRQPLLLHHEIDGLQ